MLTVETATPHLRLTPFVRSYVHRSTNTSGAEIVEPVVARLGTMLEFQFDRLYEIPVYGTNQIMFSPRITVIGPVTGRRVRLVLRGSHAGTSGYVSAARFLRCLRRPDASRHERRHGGYRSSWQ
jgi:hypothetical protein